jgi:NTP pyrophosphatase (non-canonical NTP hydrolase)
MRNSLAEHIKQSKKIDKGFKKRWGIETRIVSLAEEVGELSHDILVTEKKKTDKMMGPSIGIGLANLLYEIFLIADHYKIDLDKDWKKFLNAMPKWYAKRNK